MMETVLDLLLAVLKQQQRVTRIDGIHNLEAICGDESVLGRKQCVPESRIQY